MRFDVRDTRNKNWLWMRRELVREHGDELGMRGVAVYAALASFADESNTAYPSLSTVANMLDISRTTVQKAIKQLRSLGWIAYKNRTDESGADTSHLFLLLECPCPADDHGGGQQVTTGWSDTDHKVEGSEVSSSNSAGVRENDAVQAYQDVFPRRPNHVQAEQIATKVDDLDLWRAVMRWWATNGHRAKSVGKMLNKYRQTDNAEDLYRDAPSGDGASGDPEIASKPDDPRSQIR